MLFYRLPGDPADDFEPGSTTFYSANPVDHIPGSRNGVRTVTSLYVDSHCHLVPGIDDGAGSYDEALEMAEALAAAGFAKVWCTPHRIAGAYDVDPFDITTLVEELQQRVTSAGIPLLLAPATEYYFDEFLLSALANPLLIENNQLLVELPPSAMPAVVPDVLSQVLRSGYTPLIAHPERSPAFALPESSASGSFSLLETLRALVTGRKREEPVSETELPPLLLQLRSMGCRFQGNIGSFAGVYGDLVRENALLFLREGVYDCLGSDAHRPNQLSVWLTEGLGVVQEVVGPTGLKRLLRQGGRR